MAHFMAQVCHETSGLRCMRELGKSSYFRKYEEGRLGKMLGNNMKGDGARYKGRGLMHITGRANYKDYQDSGYCKGDIMENPELLEMPLGATKSGAWWWWKHGLNELADKDNVVAVTKRINGGTNGLASRKDGWQNVKRYCAHEVEYSYNGICRIGTWRLQDEVRECA